MSEPRSGLWHLFPSTLFGRVLASLLLAVGASFVVMVVLIVQDQRDLAMRVGGIRNSSQRIAEIMRTLEALNGEARAAEIKRLGSDPTLMVDLGQFDRTTVSDQRRAAIERTFASEFRELLGDGYQVRVARSSKPHADVIRLVQDRGRSMLGLLDVRVAVPDGDRFTFRVLAPPAEPPLPWKLFAQLGALTLVLIGVLFLVTRGITRPLSNLAQAAEAAGRSIRNPPLREEGVREIREATRAFNAMQDRLLRYLDSRTGVLAGMSHDLRTPLTRLRLRVESVTDVPMRARFVADLDEMEALVKSALALFKGVDDAEALELLDMNALLGTLVANYAEIGESVSLEGNALAPLEVKPRALRRCLTNLIDNAINFGQRAMIRIDDGPQALVISISDEGPGIPEESLERVFEPFLRLETSRSRETGGTGLGLSIARDVAQAHGGTLTLRNRPEAGLTAELRLPRS